MAILEIKTNILLSHQEIIKDKNHRYRSWEHCFNSFDQLLAGEVDIDHAALHLAFYLASWGMYRGSSQLLQKDYRVHLPVIEVLIQPPYGIFQDFNIEGYLEDSETLGALFALVDEVRSAYRDAGVTPTDTLVSKVLLGTYGCVPAYDNLFKWGLSIWNHRKDLPLDQLINQRFGPQGIKELARFYLENIDDFKAALAYISSRGVNYPPMKLVDMYFLNLAQYEGRDLV